MNPAWLLLFLPLAAAGGFVAATRVSRFRSNESGRGRNSDLPSAYFRGLNFLLNEQPDKAVEVLLEMMEVDSQTIETHIAIGNLFRRRGEVDRATRIHQAIIARPKLARRQRASAMKELGQDYFKAGLLDRAESLFIELAEEPRQAGEAYRHLLSIYEQEREWDKCVSMGRRVADQAGEQAPPELAQYLCEMAETHLAEGRYELARQCIDESLAVNAQCVRATIQLGRLEALLSNHEAAIATFKRVEHQDPRYVGEVVDLLAASYASLDDPHGFELYLTQVLESFRDNRVMLALVDTIEKTRGHIDAEAFLVGWLRRYPSIYGLHRLIQLRINAADDPLKRDLALLDGMIGGIINRDPAYECQRCGFAGRRLHWHCPGCKGWDTFLPLTALHAIEPEALGSRPAVI